MMSNICYYDALDLAKIRKALFDHVRKSCPRIDTLNGENKFIYLFNSSGLAIKEVAKFLHSAYKSVPHRRMDIFFIQIIFLFNIMLNDISFFVSMLNMFIILFCECLI